MWSLDQEPASSRKRAERGRGTPRRAPEPGGGQGASGRARAATVPADWGEVEAVIFRPPGGLRPPARLPLAAEGGRGRDVGAGTEPPAGRSGWLIGAEGWRTPGPGPGASPDHGPAAPRTGPGEAPMQAGPSDAPIVEVVGVGEPLLSHVLATLLAAGLRARCFADAEAYSAQRGDRAPRPADGGHGRLLWAAGEPDPPPGVVLVGADGPAAWALAAHHPELPHVTLPAGSAWLGARLSALARRGVVLAVGGLGGAGGSRRAALALAFAAEEEGLSVVLVDADPGSAQRWAAEPGTPGWEAARRWAADGSLAGLPELLPWDGGIARLGWAPGEDPARLPAAEVSRVCGALAASFELVIVAVGALPWPLRSAPAGASHVLACAGEDAAWPPHRCAGASVSLSVLRGRGRCPDGPALARRVGAAWAGSAADPGGPDPGRALQRLARRVWLPRLLAGAGPGAS